MISSTTINKREYWYAKNISNLTFGLGDLPLVPTFSPNITYDLLENYSKDKVLQSTALITAAQNGWLQVTRVLDDVSIIIDPNNIQAQLSGEVSTTSANTWNATQTFTPSTGPAIVAQGDVHAGDGTHHVDSQGVVRIFGMGSVNEDGSLPTDFELLNVGWDGSTNYQLVTEAGGAGVVRAMFLNGAMIDPAGNVVATSFTGDGSGLTNLPIPSVGSPFSLTSNGVTEVPLTITLAAGQTANALSVNSHGNTGGNLFSVDPNGVNAGGATVLGKAVNVLGTMGIAANETFDRRLLLAGGDNISGVATIGVGAFCGALEITSPNLLLNGNVQLIGPVIASTSSVTPVSVKLAAAQSANAMEINSVSGSGGDVFKVDSGGNVTAATISAVSADFSIGVGHSNLFWG